MTKTLKIAAVIFGLMVLGQVAKQSDPVASQPVEQVALTCDHVVSGAVDGHKNMETLAKQTGIQNWNHLTWDAVDALCTGNAVKINSMYAQQQISPRDVAAIAILLEVKYFGPAA